MPLDKQEIKLDPAKDTILIVSDSAAIHTGLGRVIREIFRPLYELKKWNIVQVGWHHTDTGEKIPWPIISTKKDDQGKPIQADGFGRQTLNEVIPRIKPDVVFGFADPWFLKHIGESEHRSKFEFIAYTCIDSEPISAKYHDAFRTATLVVTFGKWAQRVLMESVGIDSEIIPHGVNIESYHPDPQGRARVRPRIVGDRDDKIILGTIARNQPRKNLGMMFDLVHRLYYGRYAICNKCKKITLHDYNPCTRQVRHKPSTCRWCGSEKIKHAQQDDRWVWYYHGAARDIGYDFEELKKWYALDEVLYLNAHIRSAIGVSDEDLNAIYNAIDIFALPTTCEGFGLPCHPADTPILTPSGSVPIDKLRTGSKVITHKGRIRKVTGTTCRMYSGELMHIIPRGLSSGIPLTPNHKLLVAKKPVGPKKAIIKMTHTTAKDLSPEWVKAQDISKGDYLLVPKMVVGRKVSSINITDYVSGLEESGDSVYFPMSFRTSPKISLPDIAAEFGCSVETVRRSIYGITTKSSLNQRITKYARAVEYSRPEHIYGLKYITLSPDVMELLGLYIAEGSAGECKVEFDYHAKETELHEFTATVCRKIFCNAKVTTTTRGNKCRVVVSSKIAASLLSTLCGSGAANKRLHPVLMNATNTASLIRGYFLGDGCYTAMAMTASTVSKQLVQQLYKLLNQHGIYLVRQRSLRSRTGHIEYTVVIPAQFHKRFKQLTGLSCKPQGTRRGRTVINGKGCFFVPIRSVTSKIVDEPVYNLHVEGDESYLAEGFSSHNCLESMAAGTPVVLPDYSAYTDWAPAGGLMIDIGARFIDAQVGSTRVMPLMEHWIECILKLADPVLRADLGQRAVEKAKEYDWKDITPLWEKLFDSILQGPSASMDWKRSVSV